MPMFRFTIRDVLWLTVVVALAVALWLQCADISWRLAALRLHAIALRDALVSAEHNETVYLSRLDARDTETDLADVDWTLVDKFIP